MTEYDNVIMMKLDSILMKFGISSDDISDDISDDNGINYNHNVIIKKLDIINDNVDIIMKNTTANKYDNGNKNDNDEKNDNDNKNDNIDNNSNDMYEWQEYTDEHIIPDEGLNSPVCTHILDSWTTDESKKQYLLDWSNKLKLPLPTTFPQGIQFTSLSNVIKDGFLMLLIPSIRKTSIHPLQVFLKQSKKKLVYNSNSNSNSNGDPFISIDGLVYDIRVKVIGLSNENDTIINDSRSVSVDNTTTNTSSNTLNISEIFPSLVSKISALFNKHTNDSKIDVKVDNIADDNSIVAEDKQNDNIQNDISTDSNDISNNNTSRSSSTDLSLSPAERVKQRLAELRSKK